MSPRTRRVLQTVIGLGLAVRSLHKRLSEVAATTAALGEHLLEGTGVVVGGEIGCG